MFFAAVYLAAGGLAILVLWVIRSNQSRVPFATIVDWQYAFLLIFLVGAAITLIRRIRSRMFWEVAFTVTLFLGVWYVLLLVLPLGWALAIASALTLSHLFVRTVILHDLFYLIGALGVAIDFAGWLSPEWLIVGLACMAIYDALAGQPGGPIQTLAAALVRQGIVPGLVLVDRWSDLGSTVDDVMKRQSALLGAGDLILPLSLVARAAVRGPWPAAVVLGGILVGTFVLTRGDAFHPRAALPALAVGAAVPFIALRLLSLV